jgi:carbonic anhydrase/acetyltransferase-like protein (isoleucine patch superfamily)
MRKFVINNRQLILPFNEPARDLTVLMNGEAPAPLHIHLTDVVERVIGQTLLEMDLTVDFNEAGKAGIDQLEFALAKPVRDRNPQDEILVYADNLFLDREFLTGFITEARAGGRPCQAVLPDDDLAWLVYSVPLSSLAHEKDAEGGYYPLDLYYFPQGWAPRANWHKLRMYSGAGRKGDRQKKGEKGYYQVPDFMVNPRSSDNEPQDLTYYLTERSCVPIHSWVHLFNANVPLGVFSRGYRFEQSVAQHNLVTLKLLWRAILEQTQFVTCSELVKIGRNCDIDPSALILGPTTIGDNCTIGAGVVIDNCAIGDNVNIAQNCNLQLSLVGNNCFLPFRTALFMTTLMENTIVAQNSCLQMCVVGRNSFIGAGNTFTDFNLLPSPLKAIDAYGELSDVCQPVIGSCVGHNVRIGSGMVVMPARMIESDVILIPAADRRIINKSITYEMSDHHAYPPRVAALHNRLYPRRVTQDEKHVLEEW